MEIPGSNESYIQEIDDNDDEIMDEKTLKLFSSFDTVEINDGKKTYECLISQADPFMVSKYFNIPVLALRLRSPNYMVSRATPDGKRFNPSLLAGRKYQIITDEEANEKIPKCRIIIGANTFEMKCIDYCKDMIMGYMKSPQSFILVDGNGNIIDEESEEAVKLLDGQIYHVICGETDLIKLPSKLYPMPIEFVAGTQINRSMSLFPPYLICISRAMHLLTFIGEKFDLRTSTPSSLIGHTVANHAAQVLCRLNDASKKIQFVTSNISNNIYSSSMSKNSFSAAFSATQNGEISNGNSTGIKLPTTDIDHIVGALERALNDMENFLQRLKIKFQVEISTIQHIEMALKIDNGCRERKERIEEMKNMYDTDKFNEFEQVAENEIQVCPDKSQIDFQKVSESRKHFSFIAKLMEKLLQSQKMGKFSFNDLAELLNFSIEVLHYIYLHWLFIKKFSHLRHNLDSPTSEKLSKQFKNCCKYWYTVSQNVSLPTIISPAFNVQNLWKTYYESIIKAQYTVETLFFANNLIE
uniref:Uncharacterized protein n=1 Tax=Panagrolaimus superbus TaxID=310955 RepID=A0A914ZC14_9BILA